MANGNRKVFVPDHDPIDMPSSLNPEEVRSVLISTMGLSQVATARMTVDANGDIKFERPAGGTKGVL